MRSDPMYRHQRGAYTTAPTEPNEIRLNGTPIADTAIRRPVFITMMMLLAIVIGLLAYRALPVNYLPDISVATVSISVSYSGAGPQTMADQIGKPIEDTLTTDQKIEQASAALDIAKAAESALTDNPKAADVAAAQAQIAMAQARVNQPQNIQSAQASLTTAQANLEAQRDKLSQAKTSADSQVQQNALALTQAQAAYAKAKSDWQYIQDTGRNPAQPSVTNAQGKSTPNKINDSLSAQYYQSFVQAEAALHKAELTLQQSQVDAEQARQAEVTGIQSAQEQVALAQTSVDKLNLPSNADTIAMAQAALDQAKANAAKLNPAPSASDQARTSASVRQAQAALDAAKLDREHAELRAPFDGEVAAINIDPGDPSATAGQSPMRLIDVSTLHVDVNINDADIGRVTLGQTARIVAEALAGKEVSGKVSYIAPAATISGNLRTYLVRIALDTPAGLRPGMSVRVTLATQ